MIVVEPRRFFAQDQATRQNRPRHPALPRGSTDLFEIIGIRFDQVLVCATLACIRREELHKEWKTIQRI